MRRWLQRLFVGSVGLGALAASPLLVFAATRPSLDERADVLRERQLAQGLPPADADTDELRAMNPEWDFMRRTFLGLSLADDALAHPERRQADLATIDALLAGIVADEAAHGQGYYLLPYAGASPWRGDGRSLFVDGEVALLAGARRVLADDAPWVRDLHRERVAAVERAFAGTPSGLPESYPDEAWLFCVTNALVALRTSDVVDGTDHTAQIHAWTAAARAGMTEPGTGLLGSSYRTDGAMLDGPEGSTIWLVVTNLVLLDPVFARDQYARAQHELVGGVPGFAWAREWGSGWRGPVDVDSGPIVPFVDASPSSSGFAILAAKAVGDEATLRDLGRSLGAADLVVQLDPRLAELADNAMGDVIVWHGLTFGPLWAAIGAVPPGPDTVGAAFPPPAGWERAPTDDYGRSLLELTLRPEGARVLTHDAVPVPGHPGRVVDLPLVPGDLQQCADSAIRLRAEWERAQGRSPVFHATSGDPIPWARYEQGERAFSAGVKLGWRPSAKELRFEDWLTDVFRWAGTRSLALDTVAATEPRGGDLLVSPGSPGHAVVLLDVVTRGDERLVLVGEGYMPAMSFHVEAGPEGGWWRWDDGVALPHWTMEGSGLRRWR